MQGERDEINSVHSADTTIRYVSGRGYGEGHLQECYAEQLVRIIPTDTTRPHSESFNWNCDQSGAGSWSVKEWMPGELAAPGIRIAEVRNISSVPVAVMLERNDERGRPQTYRTSAPIPPGGVLPSDFNGAPEGKWTVAPDPPDIFEPAECPDPPPPAGAVRDNPIPFEPTRTPPPLTLLFQLECLQE
jgi:hypothetical protein